ncbi:hypothetical protein Taro_036014 [Colocasia esculenta]|uniref:Kinesin motor domain-containing protein n=1 Tax=Colocasia esculenta TaxID=4460 RepID=A0A843W1Y8_COLES|nr:hypothetical protein [Colocasia esculenta]
MLDLLMSPSDALLISVNPASCSCALETLSTLKFAQRAKFIRNNAIINEEASGDVLSMRLQIQQLKKEINRLRGLVHGGTEHQENDNLNIPGSPGSFKWEGQGSSSPLTFDKRISQRKEYEAALVAALRMDQDKEKMLKALAAEKEAVEQMANQRIDEVQGLKMRLRFREEGIKRLEAVASGKLSAESHLLQEKEEFLKEIEVLRNQVDRNPEVTRFAMENLREREMMNEQITALQEKLLEALDWKLMHEKGLGIQDLSLSWDSSINEENEFLHLQAIQNQREVEALRKNLNFCLEAKEKLERHVDELILQLEDERKLHNTLCETRQPLQISSQTADDQTELKTMVDAIAAASQREAEAHETAITLAKENEELRLKLNVLIEDNNKLIELYENAVSEGVARMENKVDLETVEDHDMGSEHLDISQERKVVEDLENQLHEMHEENEKLMSLYEQAMQERDEFKRLLQEQKNGRMEEEISISEKLVEVDNRGTCLQDKGGGSSDASYTEFVKLTQERLDLARVKLDIVHDNLATVERVVDSFGLLEKTVRELNNLSERIKISDGDIQSKQQEIDLLKTVYGGTHERLNIMGNKLLAVKFALHGLSPDMDFWRQREERARTKLDVHMKSIEQKKRELKVLQSKKMETDAAWRQASQSETQLRGKLNSLKSAYKVAEDQREETKKVLFAIDNLEQTDIPSQRAGQYGKAFELLKSEEEVTKLAAEVKQLREKISTAQKDATNSRKMSEEVENKLKDLEKEMRSETLLLEKAESEFRKVNGEKDVILAMRKERMAEFWDLVIDYQETVFSLDVQTTEIQMHEDELQLQMRTVGELTTARSSATEKLNIFLEECGRTFLLSGADDCSRCTSEKVVGELGHMQGAILEARSLLFGRDDER